MLDYTNLWAHHTLSPDQTLELELGTLRLLIYRDRLDWHIASANDGTSEDCCSVSIADGKPEEEQDWTRWIPGAGVDSIQFKPLLPDRPVIVRPEMPMCLMPKESVHFFVGIPLWLAITFGGKREQVIEVPSMGLSNSWFGTFTEGELCYALKTTAKLHQEDLSLSAHRVIFPLEIRNASKSKLNFERLCIRPQFLNIYQGTNRLWTGNGRVSYRGEEHWSRIVHASKAPGYDQAGVLLSRARESFQRGALLQTFDSLKQRIELP